MLRRLFRSGKNNEPLFSRGREFNVGDLIEQRFEVQQIRRGFMGVVYISYDRHRRRKVVLKTYQNKYLRDEAAIERFAAEVEIWMRLGSHPHIVRAYDVRKLLGKPHVVAEYVEGGALRSLVGHLELQEALNYAVQICWGMSHAHEQCGLMHCDLKPDNILVTMKGHAKVTDFGLARALPSWQFAANESEQHPRWRTAGVHDATPAGTLPYIAPEVLTGSSNMGVWSDIYSFGVLLFELLTGRLPFDAANDDSLVRMHLHQAPPDPRGLVTRLPDRIATIVLTCLAKHPADRYQSFREVEQEVQQLHYDLFGKPVSDYWQTGDHSEADHWSERGQAHMELGESKEAVYSFMRVVSIAPDRVDGWLNLARARVMLWQYGEAQQALNEGLERASSRNEFGPLYQLQGEMFAAMHRPRDAVQAYDKGLSFTPNAPGLWREKGALLLRTGLPREARECLERALQLDQFDAPARILLGEALMNLKHWSRARTMLREALQLDPRSINGWLQYGQCLLLMGKYRDAEAAFEHVERMQPDHPEVQEGLYEARKKQGKRSIKPPS
jgi:serine/threonine protein kinase